MRSFGHIFCFVCAMDMLEPMRPLVSALPGRLVEVYLGFKKVEEVMDFHGFSHLEPSGEAYSIHFGCTI